MSFEPGKEIVRSTNIVKIRFLIRSGNVQPHKSDCFLAIRSILYLAALQFDPNRDELEVLKDIRNGVFIFYDYASACWGMHLQSTVTGRITDDRLHQLQESLESLVGLRWSDSSKVISVKSRIEKHFSFLKESEQCGRILQAVAWYNKQVGDQSDGPTQDEALNLWQITEHSRAVLEKLITQNQAPETLQEIEALYGSGLFKCPRIDCFHYYRGFSKARKRDAHVAKHERPFMCSVKGCHMASFGFAKEKDHKKHQFDYHGLGGAETIRFPSPPIKTKAPVPQAATERKFYCELCGKAYTRSNRLKEHMMNKHEESKPYECAHCGSKIARKDVCQRHEKTCSDNPERKSLTYTCQGLLEDGSEWGCKKSFNRADTLAKHFQNQSGRKCVEPIIKQKLRTGTNSEVFSEETIFSHESGPNSEVLQAAGRLLPPFREFLQMCGLDDFHTD